MLCRVSRLILALLFTVSLAAAQESLGDAARRIRDSKDQPAPAKTGSATQSPLPQTAAPPAASKDQQSLADVAKKLSAGKKPEVVVNEEDAKKLFKEIEDILQFASDDTGLPIHTPVKHRLAGRDEVDKKFAAAAAEDDRRKRLERSELVLKKFGMLPADFHFQKFYAQGAGKGLAGFYDFREKTMYLLNWIDMEEQRPVMAHELTHALQDQNFNLSKWSEPAKTAKGSTDQDDDEPEARRAAVEGQAMIVFLDYLIRPFGRSLATTTESIDSLKGELMSVYESPVQVNAAPLILKEATYFPYFDGFAFELEVLKHEGTRTAFAGVFARPPKDTHEIMHPDDYLARVRPASVHIPSLAATLTGYKLFDAGSIGELDVRVMVKALGRENDAYSVAAKWNGGTYQALLKPSAAAKTDGEITENDLALVYVSKWKSYTAAQRFAELYKTGLVRRSRASNATTIVECDPSATGCAARWSSHFDSEEGPISMEIGADNTLVITQGLADSAVSEVKQALAAKSAKATNLDDHELTLRIAETPEVQAMRQQVAIQLLHAAAASAVR